MNKMKWLFVSLLASVMLACGTTSTVPITGRKQRLLVSDEQILSLSNQQYRQYMAKAKEEMKKVVIEKIKMCMSENKY